MVKSEVCLVAIIFLLITTVYWIYSPLKFQISSTIKLQKLILWSSRSDLQILLEIRESLKKAYKQHLPPSLDLIQALEAVIKEQDLSTLSRTKSIFTGNSLPTGVLDVCPDVWIRNRTKDGKIFGWPFFQKGFITIDCPNVRSLSEVLSIAVYFNDIKQCENDLSHILSGWKKSYPMVSIYVPEYYLQRCTSGEHYENVKAIPISTSWNAGKIWNMLAKAITTPYILIGRDLNYFDNFSQVERQIRMINYISDIVIAGGSQRNLTGHWQVGCYQINLRNYILEYLDGYYVSRNECMFCDHLLGPFITTKALLMKVPFDELLPSSLVFEDFFLKVKTDHHGFVVNCPDSMYFSANVFQENQLRSRLLWLPLAKKWKLNRIHLPNSIKHSYSCNNIGIMDCRAYVMQNQSLLLPLCCMEQFELMIKAIHDLCEKHNISYEYKAGLVLGGVKLRSLLPWSLDGDCTFYNNNYSSLLNAAESLVGVDFGLVNFKAPKGKERGFLHFSSSDFSVSCMGSHVMSKDLYLPEQFKNIPTKMLLHLTWVYTQVSPGLYARNRYGKDALKHTNFWHLSNRNSAGSFLPCSQPKHHACADHFSVDGSLQFKFP